MKKIKICDRIIGILNMEEDRSLDRLVPFSYSGDIKPDTVYNVEYCDSLPTVKEDDVIYNGFGVAIAKTENSTRIYHTFNRIAHSMTEEFDKSNYTIYLLNSFKEYTSHTDADEYFFPDLMHIDRPLSEDGFFVLHSSYIEHEGKAILFTARSGGGKSTQAELWRKYKGARVINGDKSIVGKKDGEWRVFGIPFSGSSEYCLNESYPLEAVVILAKGEKDELSEVGIRGFQPLFSQITVNRWDRDYCNNIINSVSELCDEIPVYYYSCTKEPSAADVLENELNRKYREGL